MFAFVLRCKTFGTGALQTTVFLEISVHHAGNAISEQLGKFEIFDHSSDSPGLYASL